nr:response regulator [Hyphomonas sp. Mor2]
MLEPSASSARESRAPSSRLVLIEDDENVRRSMTMLLRARGFVIDAYRSGTEFLTLQGRHGGDCLLIDYKMPRLDGLEVMRRLRAGNDQTPAIMITGYYSDSLLARARTAGFAQVLEKPASPEALIQLISETIN